MGLTILLGFAGTLLLFYGLRSVFGLILKGEKRDRRLHRFNVRQIQESVVCQSKTMAVSSILILAALCCFGAGVAVAAFYGKSESHVLDYTFLQEHSEEEESYGAEQVIETLQKHQLEKEFSDVFDMKVGYIRTTEEYENVLELDGLMEELSELPESDARDTLQNTLSYAEYPHLISLSGYNRLLRLAGLPDLDLEKNEAAIYMDQEFISGERLQIMNDLLADSPETTLDGNPIRLTGSVQTVSIVTDRSITLSFALILPDEAFSYYTQGNFDVYVDAALDKSVTDGVSLMQAISEMNQKLNETGLHYESYLQNMGRQLFYMVASSYITIYLAVIFLIVANTVMGVQFLMNQRKTHRRYKTLIKLGASYEALCQSAKKQVQWYFGIPVLVAAANSLFAVRALLSGILSSRTQGTVTEMMLVSAAMIFALCVVEWIYMAAVKRSSSRYLLTLMVPEREE